MITIYLRDSNGIYTNQLEVDEYGPMPGNSDIIAPPELVGTQVAKWTGSNWVVLDQYPTPDPVDYVDILKNKLLASIPDIRFAKETAGITVNNMKISTDRDSQSMIANAYMSMKNGFITQTDWKTADGGWVTITLAELEPIAQAVAGYVDACFKSERSHQANIDQLTTIEELNSYDVNSNWPSTVFNTVQPVPLITPTRSRKSK